MGKDLKVIYMFNGLIFVVERISNQQQVVVKNALALAPGKEPGSTSFMQAFPFTDMDEEVALQPGSYIAMTELSDKNLEANYEDAITQVRAQKSGLILP